MYVFTESTNTNDDRNETATFKDVQITRTTSTTITFKHWTYFCRGMSPSLIDNKCWLVIGVIGKGVSSE